MTRCASAWSALLVLLLATAPLDAAAQTTTVSKAGPARCAEPRNRRGMQDAWPCLHAFAHGSALHCILQAGGAWALHSDQQGRAPPILPPCPPTARS